MQKPSISIPLMQRGTAAFKVGEWYLYDDKKEAEEKIAGVHLNQIIDTTKAQKARELQEKQAEQHKQISKKFLDLI
ncbi:MAG: hypothetical protein ACI809_002650 [Candidatus Azotimanducaceae bacterium]